MKRLTIKSCIALFALFCWVGTINAQFTAVRPNAATDGFQQNDNLCGGNPGYQYRLLDNTTNGEIRSAIWNDNTIDLSDGFVESFRVRFTNNNGGADGICFSLQNAAPSVARGGGWLGYGGIAATPSLAVEFDVFSNGAGGNFSDIAGDHAALVFNNNLGAPLTAPVSLGNGDIEDGQWHGVRVIWDACTQDFDVFFDGQHVVDYTGDIVALALNGNPIVRWGFTAGKWSQASDHDVCASPIVIIPCCDSIECSEEVDLTACAEEGDFGYIALKCDVVSYQWTFPANSTAMEYTNGNQSIILNASEGHYEVVLTDAEGCTELREYDIKEDCCEMVSDCVTPESTYCFKDGEYTYLGWTAVPGATSYCLTINLGNNADCGCEGPGLSYNITGITTNSYNTKLINSKCFTWSVQAKCKEGQVSDPTRPTCFNPETPCLQPNFSDPDSELGKSSMNTTVYPNPSSGTINVELNIKQPTSVAIGVYDNAGRLIESLNTQYSTAGQHLESISLENNIQNGIYFLKIQDADGNVEFQKIIIQK